jgi:predicted patatin/cPLA2 family phospholipase
METGAAAVLRRVREKAALLRVGDVRHTALRPVLVLGGGGMGGIFSIGVLHAFAGAGLMEAFEAVFGISAGAANGAYFLSGQTGIAREVYRDHLTNDAFIKLSRRSRIVDIDYLIGVLRSVRPLDVVALRAARPLFFVSVTTLEGKPELIDVKIAADPFAALKASMAMPILYNGTVEVCGKTFVDGGAADPLPIELIIERF